MPLSEDRLADYAPLVRKLALQLLARLPASVELDDLIQAGMIGLLDAARRYQEVADAQFETYATARIRGAMLDELRNQDWLPRSVRSKAKRIDQAVAQLVQQLMRQPTEAEIAGHLDIPLTEYHQLLYEAQGAQIVHYEDFGAENDADGRDGDWTGSAVEPGPGGNPLDSLLAHDFRQALVGAIGALPEREQLLLSLCYEQGLNLKEVGAVMGVTEARVCQLRSQAMARLRATLKDGAWQNVPDDVRTAYVL
jgi:RNA polymerase sigma factor for flagellar operon FliA